MMRLTPSEAEALVGRMFPGSRAVVVDGDDRQESGAVQDANGVTIASFRLLYRAPSRVNEIPEINEIRVGDVGQFCGTPEELNKYDHRHDNGGAPFHTLDASPSDLGEQPSSSNTILVPLQIGRIDRIPHENEAQVWGHVGDYEVAIPMRLDDFRISRLV